MKFWRKPLDMAAMRPARGRVVIIEQRCKGCTFCIEYCAREVLAMSESFNRKGYHYPEARKPELCVNCHFCEAVCPEFAIFSTEEEAQA